MVLSQTYNVPELVGKFSQRWGQKFDPTSRESCCCLFEELVFGQMIQPKHAMAIVEDAKKLVCTELFENNVLICRSYDYPTYMKDTVG